MVDYERVYPSIFTTDMIISKEELLDQVKNRIGLKDVKVNSDLTEESLCFTAIVCFDGETIGSAKNLGTGGQTRLQGFHDGDSFKRDFEGLRNFISSLPKVRTRHGEIEYSAEMIVYMLATEVIEKSL